MVLKLIETPASPATNRQYQHHWVSFVDFHRKVLIPFTLPASASTVAMFAAHLQQRGLKCSTIQTYPVADRGALGPWGPPFCGALCKGVTQRLPAGGMGRCEPLAGSGAEPRRQTHYRNNYCKLAENQVSWSPSTPIIPIR